MLKMRRCRWPLKKWVLLCLSILVMTAVYLMRQGVDGMTLEKALRLPPDDVNLLEFVRSRVMIPPSNREYNLTLVLKDYSRGQSLSVDSLLRNKENGFFVECGAFDGETESVGLFLERERHWTGVLIEPNPARFGKILYKHRKAFLINACARVNSTHWEDPSYLQYETSGGTQKAVPCFWLHTILLATGRRVIDLLAVDIKGKELALLQSIHFEKFDIQIISIEMPYDDRDISIAPITSFLQTKGYKMYHYFTNHVTKTKDILFAKAAFFEPS